MFGGKRNDLHASTLARGTHHGVDAARAPVWDAGQLPRIDCFARVVLAPTVRGSTRLSASDPVEREVGNCVGRVIGEKVRRVIDEIELDAIRNGGDQSEEPTEVWDRISGVSITTPLAIDTTFIVILVSEENPCLGRRAPRRWRLP